MADASVPADESPTRLGPGLQPPGCVQVDHDRNGNHPAGDCYVLPRGLDPVNAALAMRARSLA